MNDLLNIETILGYVANNNPLRASRDGKDWESLIPAPTWSEVISKRNGSVKDTVGEIRKIIDGNYWQASKVAQKMKGESLYDTCKNIWDFLFYHIYYNEDSPGKEELRTFSRTFADRETGVDCDDFTIAGGSILKSLNIPFYIRIARYEGKDYFQHVYIVVPVSKERYITIDGVLDDYDAEKPPIETKDFLVMNNRNLNGVDISVLGGLDEELLNELSGILNGVDFDGIDEEEDMDGLGEVNEDEMLGAIRNYLVRTRNLISKRPQIIADTHSPAAFLGMVDYALKYWDTDKRDDALGILENEESRMNELEGLGQSIETFEGIDLFYGLTEKGTYDLLGKAKAPKKFFTQVRKVAQNVKQATKKATQNVAQKTKQVAKKVGTGIKKVAKPLIRYNPAVVAIRASVLLALKANVLQSASKLKWGYLTSGEAQSMGFDMIEWQKVKTQLAKAENMFVNELQGKAENFKNAILTGRAGGLRGDDLGLGAVVAATAVASTAAATPFLAKILNLLKNIDFTKLIKNVNALKLNRKAKAAERESLTPEGGSAMPEGGQTSENLPEETQTTILPTEETPIDITENSSSSSTNSEQTENSNITTSNDGAKTIITSNPSNDSNTNDTGSEESSNENSNPDNLPANTGARGSAPSTTDAGTKENFFTKAVSWVKENPTTSILVAGGAAFLVYGLTAMGGDKKKQALSGTSKRGKLKKGKKKKNPPRVITGVGKSKRKKQRKHNKRKHPRPKERVKHKSNRSTKKFRL